MTEFLEVMNNVQKYLKCAQTYIMFKLLKSIAHVVRLLFVSGHLYKRIIFYEKRKTLLISHFLKAVNQKSTQTIK